MVCISVVPTNSQYVLLAISGDHRDAKPIRMLTTRIIELEKLQENRLEV
jgi:hypothetical protein